MRRVLVFHRDHCLACRSCELACSVAHSASGELGLLGRKMVLKPLPTKSAAKAASGPSGGGTCGGAGLVWSGRSSPKKKSLGKLMDALVFESLMVILHS